MQLTASGAGVHAIRDTDRCEGIADAVPPGGIFDVRLGHLAAVDPARHTLALKMLSNGSSVDAELSCNLREGTP